MVSTKRILNFQKLRNKSTENYILALFFAALIPFLEWPDTLSHLQRTEFYSTSFKGLSNILGVTFAAPKINSDFKYFADSFLYIPSGVPFFENLMKLPFVFAIIYFLNKFSLKITNQALVFCPPLIFSLLAISMEPFAIFFTIISFYLILKKENYKAFIFSSAAIYIDRSLVPSVISIALIFIFNSKKKLLKYATIISVIFFLTILQSKYLADLIIYKTFLADITFFDILLPDFFGQHNFFNSLLKLIASLSGLFGSMSLRPFPYLLYYFIILTCFAIGFLKSEPQEKFFFFLILVPIFLLLLSIPDLNHARYFPLLEILFWNNVVSGSSFIFSKSFFKFVILTSISIGLLRNFY